LVECTLKDTGEYILSTAGEIHLERCIEDLTKLYSFFRIERKMYYLYLFRYARIEVNVSAPIIPFRETIIPPPKVDFLNESIANQQQFKSNKTAKERPSWLLGNFLY
jgi:ribosome assembly protein 1